MSKRWKPNNSYYYIDSVGIVTRCTWDDDHADALYYEYGNCFETREQAEAAAAKIKELLLSVSGALETPSAKLPKLTTEIFNHPDCPEWAQYAAVNKDGKVVLFSDAPSVWGDRWSATFYITSTQAYLLDDRTFDASDWQNSLIERPAKNLPDWCKVGELFWHPEDMAGGRYLKITEIRGGGVYAKEKEDYDPDYLCFDLVRKYSKQARLRPYDGEEIPDLPFEVRDRNSNFRTTVVSCQGERVWLAGATSSICTEELMRGFTTKGSPCGILEHREDGEWVK